MSWNESVLVTQRNGMLHNVTCHVVNEIWDLNYSLSHLLAITKDCTWQNVMGLGSILHTRGQLSCDGIGSRRGKDAPNYVCARLAFVLDAQAQEECASSCPMSL
jgi:hypothetical protein